MSWLEIASLVIAGGFLALALVVAALLVLLTWLHNRAVLRRQLCGHRRNAGISLPREYEHRHWVDLSQ